MMDPEIKNFKLNRIENGLPLCNTDVKFELLGSPTAVINAIRRVVTDEMTGYAMYVPNDGFDIGSDEFMLPQFVNQRISLIPLRYNVGDDFTTYKYKLYVVNDTTEVKKVYSGDLELVSGDKNKVIFNPTFKIAFLQPGRYIKIDDISIDSGIGIEDMKYQVACLGRYRHLDLERFKHDELHKKDGKHAYSSGYVKSSMLSYPTHHLFECTIPSTVNVKIEVVDIFIGACINIKNRFKYILSYIDSNSNQSSLTQLNSNISYNVYKISSGDYEAILILDGETYTVAELIKRTMYDLKIDMKNIVYVKVSNENKIKMTIQYKEHVDSILIITLKQCIYTFDKLENLFIKLKK